MSSEEKIIEATSKGITKGTLEWTEEKVINLIKKFKNKNLAFIQDEEAINDAKEQRKKGEWAFFNKYIKNKDYHILFQIGLTLRSYEQQRKDFRPLQRKVINKYGEWGLHIVHFVQNGLFSKYIGNILERISSDKEIKSEVETLFKNIDNTVVYIRRTDNPKQKINMIITKIRAHSPETFIISSIGGATDNCKGIKNGVMREVSSDYECEEYQAEGRQGKRVYFLNKKRGIPFFP